MLNHWRIDYDALECVVVHTRSCQCPEDADLPVKFRLLDDDGGICYYGRMAGYGFDPLDDYGMPAAGCTELQYMNPKDYGAWKTL